MTNDCCFAALHSGNQFVLDLQTVYNYAYGYFYGYSHAHYEDGYSLFEIPGGVFKYTQIADGDDSYLGHYILRLDFTPYSISSGKLSRPAPIMCSKLLPILFF